MTRRSFFPAAAALAASPVAAPAQPAARKGRLKQGATRSCFGRGMSFPEVCKHAARLGLKGIDLVGKADWPVLKEHGLLCTMAGSATGISQGTNHKENHARMVPETRRAIERAAAAGFPNVIVLSGERKGISDEQGIANTVAFLNQVKAVAEDKGVTLCLELLNSKVDHPDYHCDRTSWGVEVCKRVNSPRVKLLYDIYHMQIMEGDVIRTIRENIQWIGHFHTAGNPGRNEIDASQELNYRAIAQAIVDAGFTGYLSHEYSPRKDPIASLDEAIRICDV